MFLEASVLCIHVHVYTYVRAYMYIYMCSSGARQGIDTLDIVFLGSRVDQVLGGFSVNLFAHAYMYILYIQCTHVLPSQGEGRCWVPNCENWGGVFMVF